MRGGLPPSKIKILAEHSVYLGSYAENLTAGQLKSKELLKRDFADLLFPALVKNDPAPFNELLEAMAKLRREITFAKNGVIVRGKMPKTPPKKEVGRRFRDALFNLLPDDLINIQTVKTALQKAGDCFVDNDGEPFFADDSKIYHTMAEVNISFLKPGDVATWAVKGKVVRVLRILSNGKPKITGMTLSDISKIRSKDLRISRVK